MQNMDQYELGETIHQGRSTIVQKGTRVSDKTPVIIKLLRSEHPSSVEITHLKRQYDIIQGINSPGVVKVFGMEANQNQFALILEDFGGVSLDRILQDEQMELDAFFDVAIELAGALGDVHSHNIIHKDIKPHNIIFNQVSGMVKLTDFSIASLLTRENQEITNPDKLEGSLPYISPEQTGRMNRSIDYRTDFYSLGVTFYQILTGKLPFESNDPLELIHGHIAMMPTEPHALRSEIPQVLSSIVMKLLSKNAEDRYQGAFGLKYDLEECRKQWKESRKIEAFSIGSRDISDRFSIPQKLYGREGEIEALMEGFQRAREGGTHISLVFGYAGSGKSSLVKEIRRPIAQGGGTFIAGKYDSFQKNVPFSAIIVAFQDLIRQILSESDASITRWKERLLEAMGENGQIIIDIIPDVERITGPQEAVQELPPAEAQNRFNLVFLKFIGVFTSPEHPLTIFLDDMHWADSASLRLVQTLLGDSGSSGVYLVGSYRENEVDDSHPLVQMFQAVREQGRDIREIHLEALPATLVSRVIQDTLKTDEDQARPLTDMVFAKTNGNPFFVNEFLKSIYEEELLSFNPREGKWEWDLAGVEKLGITDNVVEVIAGKVKKLDQNTQEILKLASCIGNPFELEILSGISNLPPALALSHIWEAVEEGLIIADADRKVLHSIAQSGSDESALEGEHLEILKNLHFSYLHDRVQEAAYSMIEEERRHEIHLATGRLIRDRASGGEGDESLFDMVNHLNPGRNLITDPAEKLGLSRFNLDAGKKAQGSTAYGAALEYYKTGIELLESGAWDQEYDLSLALHTGCAEAAYLVGEFSLMEEMAKTVVAKAKNLLDRVKISEIKIQSCMSRHELLEAIGEARSIAKELGTPLPGKPSQPHIIFNLIKTKRALGGRSIDDLEKLPDMSDPIKQATMRILMTVSSAAYMAMPNLFPVIVFKMVALSARFGHSVYAPYAFATYGLLVGAVLGDPVGGNGFGNFALKLTGRYKGQITDAKVYALYYGLTAVWTRPISETLAPFLIGYGRGLNAGDLEYAALDINLYCIYRFYAGIDLREVKQDFQKYIEATRNIKQEKYLNATGLDGQLVTNLEGKTRGQFSLTDDVRSEEDTIAHFQQVNDVTSTCIYYSHKLFLHYIYGDFEEATKFGALFEKTSGSVLGLYYNIISNFYDSLSHGALARSTPAGKGKHLKRIAKNQKKLKKWSVNSPVNCQHKLDLIEAERQRLIPKKDKETEELYESAIAGARSAGFKQEEALAHALAADFHTSRQNREKALQHMTEATYLFTQWGAPAIVRSLEERYPDLILQTRTEREATPIGMGSTTHAHTTTTTSGGGMDTSLDLATVMKASRTISSEIEMGKLLEKLITIMMENSGAQKGLLLMKKEDGELRIGVERELGKAGTDSENAPLSLDESQEHLSTAIVRYVARTENTIILNDALHEGDYTDDPYIKKNKPQSILCSPIQHQGKLIGIVYLENNLSTGAFTPDRLEILGLLSSQAAISLENASLYASLEEKVEERTRELRKSNEALEESKKEIDDIMENVSQGLMTIYPDGSISPEYSHRVVEIFDRTDLGNTKFYSIFKRDQTLTKRVGDYIEQMFTNQFMSDKIFEATNPLRQNFYVPDALPDDAPPRVLEFGFSRIFKTDEGGEKTKEIQKLMVVIDDRTDEYALKKELEKKAEEQSSRVEKLYQILQLQPSVFSGFISESSEILDGVNTSLGQLGTDRDQNQKLLQRCFREVHTLKGNARALNLDSIGKTAHELEDVFADLREEPEKMDAERKERVLSAVASLKNEIHDGNALFEKILNMQHALKSHSNDLMGEFEERLKNIVEREKKSSSKLIEFKLQNDLKRPLPGPAMVKLRNPLSHLIRNSFNHGIESPEERSEIGKDPTGTILLRISESDGFIDILLEDDGRGLDTDRIREKAIEMGAIKPEELADLPEKDVHRLIFTSGLSTAHELSESAGRGVGMDAVKEDLKNLGAKIFLGSKKDKYTRFVIRIPIGNVS